MALWPTNNTNLFVTFVGLKPIREIQGIKIINPTGSKRTLLSRNNVK